MAGVAILGFGVVGSGVAEVLRRNNAQIGQKLHSDLELKYILTRRDYPDSLFAPLIIHDFSVIERDTSVEVVVEVIGGVGAAKEYTLRALRAGKSVVTANKELVATCGYELMTVAKENGVSYLYEASVGGGIPIIRPLKQCLAANEITEIRGILNGTTNYILTRMIRDGISFQDALASAQEKGYAEADPTADVEGFDACRKICILASLAFGDQISPERVSAEGISSITLADVAYAQKAGYRIKLLGRALRERDGKLRVYVAPHFISEQDPLAGVEGVFNAITVCGNVIGDVMFYGQGAGKLPTASAVVADIMEAVARKDAPKYPDWNAGRADLLSDLEEKPCRWYIRGEGSGENLLKKLCLSKIECGAEKVMGLTVPMTEKEVKAALAGCRASAAFRVLGD